MAISLDSIGKPTQGKPVIATFVADGGGGKTSLAASFPSPIFIKAEDGTESIVNFDDVQEFPLASRSSDVLDAIRLLATEEHDRKTLVIDSVTMLNYMFEKELVEADSRAESINTVGGGYGAGWNLLSDKHRQIREWCGALSEKKGMHIVFLAHADIESVDLPDADPYSRFSIRMHKKSVAHYSDNVSLIGYIKQKMYLKGDGDQKKKKAVTDGSRIITCHSVPSHISKNRYGITEDLPFEIGKNPFVPFIESLKS
jgi:hypothetical protein